METHLLHRLPIFFSIFFSIYTLAYFLLFRHWSPKIRPEASSCAISLAHGTPAVFLAGAALLSDPARGLASPNTHFQSSVLDYSIAYFLMDLLHYLLFFPGDLLFIAHHLATLFVFLTCRYLVAHGAVAILLLLILAEVTSFCQNAWTLARARRGDAAIAARVCDLLSPPFYVLYSIVRGLFGPWFLYRMGVFYANGGARGVIPDWVWVSWICVVAAAISVSILWIMNLWVELFRERSSRNLEEEKKKKVR